MAVNEADAHELRAAAARLRDLMPRFPEIQVTEFLPMSMANLLEAIAESASRNEPMRDAVRQRALEIAHHVRHSPPDGDHTGGENPRSGAPARVVATGADIDFYFDPVCPFCWMTSKWVRQVRARRGHAVNWRFISLRQVNAHVDYAAQFPPDYEAGHTAGLRLLRVAARTRAEHGPAALDRLYAAMGDHIFERTPEPGPSTDGGICGTTAFVAPILAQADLPSTLVCALDDASWDPAIQAETARALTLTGKDVGTPIVHFDPPDGVAFFGPVISRMPTDDQALDLWDHVVGLARFPGFAELKRSLRERPQLPSFGVGTGEVGRTEDWHGGSRRQHR